MKRSDLLSQIALGEDSTRQFKRILGVKFFMQFISFRHVRGNRTKAAHGGELKAVWFLISL